MKKRIISLLLAVMIIAGMLPFSAIPAFAAEEDEPIAAIYSYWSRVNDYAYYYSEEELDAALKAGPQTTKEDPGNFRHMVLDLEDDVTLSDFAFPGNADELTIHLNSHTMTITAPAHHKYQTIRIYGDGGTIDFSNCDNGNNTVLALDNVVDDSTTAIFTVENTTFANIKAGRLFSIGDVGKNHISFFEFSNVNITNGTFTQKGGAVYINEKVYYHDIPFTGCNFVDISSPQDGGAVYVENMADNSKASSDEQTRLVFNDCNFVNCSSQSKGGAMYIYEMSGSSSKKATVAMTGCNFVNCTAQKSGGAIFVDDENIYFGCEEAETREDKNLFSGCVANTYGGAIYDDNGRNTFENMIFTSNQANDDEWGGGAMHIYGDDTVVKNCEFYVNEGAGYGGAVSIDADDASFENCIFAGNVSDQGKDIYVGRKKDAPSITGCTVYGYDSVNSLRRGSEGIGDAAKNTFIESLLKFSDGNTYNADGSLKKGNKRDNPIPIENLDDLLAFATCVKADSATYADKYYKLTNDIDRIDFSISDFTGEFNFNHKTLTTRTDGMFDQEECIVVWPSVINVLGEWEKYDRFQIYFDDYSSGLREIDAQFCLVVNDGDDISELTDGIYLIHGTVNTDERIRISGNVTLVFDTNAVLNANNGIALEGNNTLNLYSADAGRKGTLNAVCTDRVGAGIGGSISTDEKYLGESHAVYIDDLGMSYYGSTAGSMGVLNASGVNIYAEGNGGAGIGGAQGTSAYIPSKLAYTTWDSYRQEYRWDYHVAGLGGNGGTLNVCQASIEAVGNGGRDIGGGDGGDGAAEYIYLDRSRGGCTPLLTGAGGGNGTAVTMYSGEIIAKVRGIGGGNCGENPDATYSAVDSACANRRSGGNGGKITLYGGSVKANTVNGGTGVAATTETAKGEAGAMTVLTQTTFGVRTADTFEELKYIPSSGYTPSYDERIASKYVELLTDPGTYYVVLHSFAGEHMFRSLKGLLISKLAKEEYNKLDLISREVTAQEIVKVFYENGEEVGAQDKLSDAIKSNLILHSVTKITELTGKKRTYYYNSFDGFYYSDENCKNRTGVADFARGGGRWYLVDIGNWNLNSSIEFEFSPMESLLEEAVGGGTIQIGDFCLLRNTENGVILWEVEWRDNGKECVFDLDNPFHTHYVLTPGEKYTLSISYQKRMMTTYLCVSIKQDGGSKCYKEFALSFQQENAFNHITSSSLNMFRSDMALHDCKVYKFYDLVHHLVPMKLNYRFDQVCLYDECNGKYYYTDAPLSTKTMEPVSAHGYGTVYYCTEDGNYYNDPYGLNRLGSMVHITYTGAISGSFLYNKEEYTLPVCDEAGYRYGFLLGGAEWDGTTFPHSRLTVNVIKAEEFKAVGSTCTVAGHKTYYKHEGLYYENPACTRRINDLTAWLSEGGAGFVPLAPHTDADKDNICDVCKKVICEHNRGYSSTEVWSSDCTNCTWVNSCIICGTVLETQDADKIEIVSETAGANCRTRGEIIYEATWYTRGSVRTSRPGKKGDHIHFTTKYSWNHRHTTCTASKQCVDCTLLFGNEYTEDIETSEIPATCFKKGSITYTAHFNNFESCSETVETDTVPHTYNENYICKFCGAELELNEARRRAKDELYETYKDIYNNPGRYSDKTISAVKELVSIAKSKIDAATDVREMASLRDLYIASIRPFMGTKEHEHTFSTEYTYNETHHWREATCGCDEDVIDGFGSHKDKDLNGICDVCGKKMSNDGAQLSSTFSGGNLWLIGGIAVVVIIGVAAYVVVKKKKKTAAAGAAGEASSNHADEE